MPFYALVYVCIDTATPSTPYTLAGLLEFHTMGRGSKKEEGTTPGVVEERRKRRQDGHQMNEHFRGTDHEKRSNAENSVARR